MTSPAHPACERPKRSRDLAGALYTLRGMPRIFWICLLVYMLDGAAYFGILNILTLFLGQDVGMTDSRGGLFVSGYTGLVTLFSAILGSLTDRWGVGKTLTITIWAALVGRVLLAAAPSVALSQLVVTLGLVLMAFSAGAMQPAVYAGVGQATNARTKAIGFSLLYALMNGGIVLESAFSSPVRAEWGPVGVMWMCAAITLTYLALHLFGFPRAERGPIQPPAEKERGGAARSWREHPLLDPRFLFFIFVLLGVRTLFAHQWLTMPDYVTRAYAPEVGARFEQINALNPLIILVGTPLVALVTRKFHVVDMMVAGTLVSTLSTFLLVPGPQLWALLAYVIIFSIGEAMWCSRFLEYVASVAPPSMVGVYMGVAQIPWFIAKFTTGFYSGWMLSVFCPAEGPLETGTLWLIYAIAGLSSPIGLLLARKWLKRGTLAGAHPAEAGA